MIIEHVVLFRVKSDADPSQITAFINGLNSLSSLDQVIHLTAGTLHSTQSSSLTFTHILYSRYNTLDDLNAYTVHPAHVSLVNQTLIIDDVMAVDWFSDFTIDTTPGSALKFMFVKMKENSGESERVKVLEVIRGLGDEFGSIIKMSFGEDIFLNRAKGYSIGVVMVFRGVDHELNSNLNLKVMILQNEKISDLVEDVLALDYITPCSSSD